jgi:hypothetical protein
MPRRLPSTALALVLALAMPRGLAAQETELQKGIRLVDSGDYADALLSLDAAVRQMEAAKDKDPSRLGQAHLYLGIAYIGLSHHEAARAQFAAALEQVPSLRLTPEQYPPKVIETFEAARNRQTAAPGKSKSKVVLLGVGAAAAVGVAVAAGGGGGGSDANNSSGCASGQLVFGNARFEVPNFECPVGASGLNDPAGIVIDAVNTTCSAAAITSAATSLTVVASFGTVNPVGQSFPTDPAPYQPTSVSAGGATVPVRVTSNYFCNNTGSGGTFNEVVGSVTLQTSLGAFTVRTVNTHRSTFP